MPAGRLVTSPEPLPRAETVSTNSPSNVAVTALEASIRTVQSPVPPQPPPLQPVNVEPGAAEARSVTRVPCAKPPVQELPQSMPPGSLDTVPAPLPALTTVSRTPAPLNVAVTVLDASIRTVQ